MEALIAKRLLVRGRVQGVGYRAAMYHEALRLGLRGWVRNRHDGAVEALVCGHADQVAAIVAWAQHGPRFAVVSQVEEHAADIPPGAGFDILSGA